jgi:transcriptional regulator with GAF, ATPase, and Fis domain
MSQEPPDAGLRPEQFQALLEVSESITRHGDLAELFHDLARRLRRVVPFDFISVLLHDDAMDMMRLHIPLAAPATLDEAEREDIVQALKQTNWVVGGPAGAAARLGMKRTTLLSRMRKLGIRRPR